MDQARADSKGAQSGASELKVKVRAEAAGVLQLN